MRCLLCFPCSFYQLGAMRLPYERTRSTMFNTSEQFLNRTFLLSTSGGDALGGLSGYYRMLWSGKYLSGFHRGL